MKNILVVSVNWLGDVIFSTPVFKALKEANPGSRVAVLAVPRVLEVFSLTPWVDDVIVFDEEGEHRPLLNRYFLVRAIEARKFDAVFLLRPSVSRALLCAAAGIPVRIGFSPRSSAGLLTEAVDDSGLESVHRSDRYAALLERYGIQVTDRVCALQVSEELQRLADSFLEGHGIKPGEDFCVFNTGGNWGLKQWPENRFVELAKSITAVRQWKIVLPGSAKDMERVSRLGAAMGSHAVSVAGGTSLPMLAAIFSRARCLISADSGPLHLASAVGTPVVGIFGPTRPEITGPRGSGKITVLFKDIGCNKAPCYYLECPDNRCMQRVEVSDVINVL